MKGAPLRGAYFLPWVDVIKSATALNNNTTSITAFSIATSSVMTFSTTAHRITTFTITTLSLKINQTLHSIASLRWLSLCWVSSFYSYTEHPYAECRHAECCYAGVVKNSYHKKLNSTGHNWQRLVLSRYVGDTKNAKDIDVRLKCLFQKNHLCCTFLSQKVTDLKKQYFCHFQRPML